MFPLTFFRHAFTCLTVKIITTGVLILYQIIKIMQKLNKKKTTYINMCSQGFLPSVKTHLKEINISINYSFISDLAK